MGFHMSCTTCTTSRAAVVMQVLQNLIAEPAPPPPVRGVGCGGADCPRSNLQKWWWCKSALLELERKSMVETSSEAKMLGNGGLQ